MLYISDLYCIYLEKWIVANFATKKIGYNFPKRRDLRCYVYKGSILSPMAFPVAKRLFFPSEDFENLYVLRSFGTFLFRFSFFVENIRLYFCFFIYLCDVLGSLCVFLCIQGDSPRPRRRYCMQFIPVIDINQ